MMEWPGTERMQHPRDAEEIADLVSANCQPGQVTYGVEVRQNSGEWLAASSGRTREYADSAFKRYVAGGDSCRIVNSVDETISEHVVRDCGSDKAKREVKLESKVIDLSKTRFFMITWPDQKVALEVTWFIEEATKGLSVHPDYRNNVFVRDRTCARNTAMRRALDSPKNFEWFMFIDNDVRPLAKTMRFLNLTNDVNCCEVPMRTESAWSWPNAFHESLWWTSRAILEAIEPPWFMQAYNKDGTSMEGCICKSFQKKVLDADFTIAHGGWAKHDRDASWC